MRDHTLILILAISCFSGCGESRRQTSDQSRTLQDSAHFASSDPHQRIQYADSLEELETKRLSAIAYKDIKFGDNASTVRNKIGFFETIGQYKYAVGTHYTSGKKDLYSISFGTYPFKTANYYDTDVKAQWHNLVDVISEKYGPKHGVFPSFFNMKSEFVVWTHIWRIGTKEIAIGVAEQDATYYALLEITDLPRQEQLQEKQGAKDTESIKKSSKHF
jgi:hypothetical protein